MSGQPARKQAFVRELLGRSDYAIIGDIVEPGTKVLDWAAAKANSSNGSPRTRAWRRAALRSRAPKCSAPLPAGVSVYQGDIDQGLADYPDGAFDYVILSQTLQETHRPRKVLREMLRVGRRAIVAFPNFGHGGCGSPCW